MDTLSAAFANERILIFNEDPVRPLPIIIRFLNENDGWHADWLRYKNVL